MYWFRVWFGYFDDNGSFGSVEVLSTFKKVPAWFEFCKCRVQDQFGSGSSSTELESGEMFLRQSSVTK